MLLFNIPHKEPKTKWNTDKKKNKRNPKAVEIIKEYMNRESDTYCKHSTSAEWRKRLFLRSAIGCRL